MIKLRTNKTLTLNSISYLNKKYPDQEILILLENTKLQQAKILEECGKNYPNIKYSVLGGLNPIKKKFNTKNYQQRTYFTGIELSKIIKIFSSIERNIELSWTETQKAMFVYKELCNYMQYSEIEVNNKDYARGLGGLLYKKAVCSGFSMIYKEALDRLGIECHYQNRKGYHSWNIAKLDGEYRALELTWDTSNKSKNGCEFLFFNRDKNFYGNPKHNIDNELEETKYKIVPYSIEELKKNCEIILNKRIKQIPVIQTKNNQIIMDEVKIEKIPVKFYLENGIINLLTKNINLIYKQFIRNDNTSFIIIKSNTEKYKGTNKYFIIEPRENYFCASTIYTETELHKLPLEFDTTIANGLLGKDRLKEKIKNYNGYVGYIGNNYQIYYNTDFEKENLNIIR